MRSLTTTVSDKQKTSEAKFNEKIAESRFMQQKRKTKLQTEQKCPINGGKKQDWSTYSTVIKLVKRHHEPPVLLAL